MLEKVRVSSFDIGVNLKSKQKETLMLNSTDKIIKHNVSKACKVMGLSRDTCYRYKAAVEEGGVDALSGVNLI